MRFGFHVSIGGGLPKAVGELAKLEAGACQMFSRSPRGGKAKKLDPQEVRLFRELCTKHDINPVVVHIPYVLNLATSDPEMHAYAVDMVREDMERANTLGARYLVLHLGSHRGAGEEKGLAQVMLALQEVLRIYTGETVLLLENTAGGGAEVGYSFEHLAVLMAGIAHEKTGICFDTCHGFAYGYDLAGERAVDDTFNALDKIVGLRHLKLIHANDSMFPIGSKKDRHAHIGRGYIGETGFRAILRHPALQDVPFILETPVDEQGDFATNLETLRRLAQ
ncbi:deoxyribonuclease IV [bacterium]|nr:MAG: deoxyribonuclease IV [bacterium]